MHTWSGKARRRRPRRRAAARNRPAGRSGRQLILPLAVPMALGLALGVVVAESGGTTTKLTLAPAGAQATASATARASASVSASASPPATQNASANADCELIVPVRPLTATGLATPYQLTGPGGQDPAASGCTHAGRPGTSQTLDELSAAASQRAPVALVPENDPMTMVNGAVSAPKTNLYRLGVGQPLVIGMNNEPFGDMEARGQQADTPANFCANMINLQTAFIAASQERFSASPSPVPGTGSNLFTFMAAR